MSKPIIEVRDLKKKYRMGQIGGGTLTADLQSWWAKVRKKEDPNLPIGINQRLMGQTFMALNGVSFSVQAGEALGIIGGNGAGKSTLLKLISRITAPSNGEITLRGRVASMLEVGTGFNGEMTGRENIYMNGAILGMTKAEIDAKIADIISFSECEEFIDTPVKRYSSGMYVKLAFSVASHLASEIMIMDEVLAVGDVKFQKKCIAKMRDESSVQGRTILYVSHNMSTIRQLCTRCIVLKEGKVIFDGATEDAIAVYEENSVNEFRHIYDLENKVKTVSTYATKAQLVKLELPSTDTGEYSPSKPLKFTLQWRVLQDVGNLYLRTHLYFKDGTPVAIIFSDSLDCTTNPNVIKNASLIFDVSHLMGGDYYMDFYLQEQDENLMPTVYDGFSENIPLRILSQKGFQGWGYTRYLFEIV